MFYFFIFLFIEDFWDKVVVTVHFAHCSVSESHGVGLWGLIVAITTKPEQAFFLQLWFKSCSVFPLDLVFVFLPLRPGDSCETSQTPQRFDKKIYFPPPQRIKVIGHQSFMSLSESSRLDQNLSSFRSFQFLTCVRSGQALRLSRRAAGTGLLWGPRSRAHIRTSTQTSCRTFPTQILAGNAPLNGFSVTMCSRLFIFWIRNSVALTTLPSSCWEVCWFLLSYLKWGCLLS